MPRLVLISDTHGRHDRLNLPDGDILVHAGDALRRGHGQEALAFGRWMAQQPHEHKVYVPGNHDEALQDGFVRTALRAMGLHVLKDHGADVAGLRFYGSPWTPQFGDWAFMLPDAHLACIFDRIPVAVDVLVTHGPPHGVLDRTLDGRLVGSRALLADVERTRPTLHVFGHIHEARGDRQVGETTFLNVASLDRSYQADRIRQPVVWDVEPRHPSRERQEIP